MTKIIDKIAKVFSFAVLISALVVVTIVSFLVGYLKGYESGWAVEATKMQQYLASRVSATTIPVSTPPETPRVVIKYVPVPTPMWGGPQLWDAVNKRRVELGVNPLALKEELCTIASIRLNEILELGKLDGHIGFSNMPQTRPDLKWIFDQYNLSEFLVAGASTPQEAVSLWENTLGHRELLSGGQYVWGCIYAQNGFGVAIAAY